MDTRDLKKYLAGFGVAGLLAGAGLMFGPSVNTASAA
jgi:radical SAM modification target selenobiotic family peptide